MKISYSFFKLIILFAAISFLLAGFTSFFPFGPGYNFYSPKPFDDINNKYTTVGNISLTVTNYGTIGKGYCGTQPSCMYPKGSGIENLWLGGLWVGGIKNGLIHVTTGAIDVSNANKQEGFEYSNAPGSTILERSSLLTSPFYSPNAISHQDFVCEFYDTSLTNIQNHNPLGIKVLLETYTYNLNFANFFVILNYKIVNIGYNGDNSQIDSLYLGVWKDFVVRNINVTPGCNAGTAFFSKNANGYIDSLRMEYAYDHSGDVGFTDNYVALKLLGVTPKSQFDTVKSHFTIWQFKNNSDPIYFSPTTDEARYSKMKGYLSSGPPPVIIDSTRINQLRLNPGNRVSLLSYGPCKKTDGSSFSLRYQLDTINVVFAVICAKKYGTDPASFDSSYQKKYLYTNAGWAQRAYDNGYKLPAPPDIPLTRAELDNHTVTLWWTNNSELSVDPISGKRDFEGYRIYRTNPGTDINQNFDPLTQFKLIADFDSAHNNIGNNTGFGFIKQSNYTLFDGDTNKYWYKFEFPNQLNGFQYLYTVTGYDKGDSSQNLSSLESSLLANSKRIVVGTLAQDNGGEIGVYPNPYYGSAIWDGPGSQKEVLRKIYFFNLPSKCEISIWTLSGDLVITMTHDASTYNGQDIQWFKTYSDPSVKFAGGEHAWDLITKNNQAVATGLYLFTVKNSNTGEIKKGKFLIVK